MIRGWLIAFAVCTALTLLSVFLVDRPVAEFVHTISWARALREPVLGLPVLVGIAALAVIVCGASVLAGRTLPHWAESLMLSALALGWALLMTELLLKPLFGRTPPDLLIEQRLFHFAWLQGDLNSSFPSGHAAQMFSISSVLWLTYPRWRLSYALTTAAVMLALLLGNWHFVADVIAGGFVGASSGIMIVGLWRARRSQDADGSL